MVFTLALTAQTTWIPSSTISRREKELELLFRGEAYVSAIASYYYSDKKSLRLPQTLGDLLDDPRVPGQHHIRSLYPDPISDNDWIIIYGEDRGVLGVMSSSKDKPIKQSGFSGSTSDFVNSDSYSEWVFEFNGAN